METKMIRNYLLLLTGLIMLATAALAQSEKKAVRQGNREFKRGEFLDSEISYRSAIEANPSSLKGNFNLGDALYKQEKFDEATQLFQDIANAKIESNDKARVYHNLGNSFFKQQKFAESVEAYKNALRHNPSDQETKYNLAQAQRFLVQQQQQKDKQDKNDDKDKDKQEDKDKKDKQDQDKDKQDNKEQDKQDQKQQPKEQQISPEDAKRMLEAIQNDEKKVQDKVREMQARKAKVKVEKNW
jgi:tetratricopeptide (TPR) repeat protein